MSHKLGICIPYRNRKEHIERLIPHLSKQLTNQGIEHSFYVGHQVDDKLFNRGAMKNIASHYAFEDGCDYVAWHDVDMLSYNINGNIGGNYSYPEETPIHIATKLSKYNYGLGYDQYFGGVVLFTKEQVEKTNGYSNDYWDWGMEDDDIFWRCVYEGYVEKGLFKKYENKKTIVFNGESSYIEIPKELELDNILSKSHTISILCNVEEQSDKYKEWLVGDETKSFIEHPIFRHNKKHSYAIGFNNSRAITSSVHNNKNEFTYGWIKRNFNDWTWITFSVDEENNKMYFYCNNVLVKNLQNGTLEETYSEFTGKLKKLTSNFYIGKNSDDKSSSVADFLKGKVAEIKIWDKFIPKEFILENKETPIFELENNSNLIYNDTEISYDTFEVCNNKIPYRREGRFLSLPHIDEGFVNGKWVKGETTAKNERRLFLEMKKEKLNYKEDGIAQIKYDLVSKEQISDNAWMINVKL